MLRNSSSESSPVVALAIVAALLSGCGGGGDAPELAAVRGKVTLDGQPLSGAVVSFRPNAAGRGSGATTDADGDYVIRYSSNLEGAILGEHRVSIRTYQAGEEQDDGQITGAVPEKVPIVYNAETTLVCKVEAGSNECNFELKSDAGEIVQPGDDEEEDY